jgi:hypothetical protein
VVDVTCTATFYEGLLFKDRPFRQRLKANHDCVMDRGTKSNLCAHDLNIKNDTLHFFRVNGTETAGADRLIGLTDARARRLDSTARVLVNDLGR